MSCNNNKCNRRGFATAIVLIFLAISSILLLSIYEIVGNYRNSAIKMRLQTQLDTDALNILNVGVGFLKAKSAGLLGFTITFSPNTPSWYNSDFLNKLNDQWRSFVNQNVQKNATFKIVSLTTSESYFADNLLRDEISSYKLERGLSSIELYAFRINQLQVFLISRTEKNGISVYSYGIVGSKLLNQYAYFTNKESISTSQRIFFKAGELIDGPVRSHDYININPAGGKPTFLSTIEVLGIKDARGNIVQPQNYLDYANLQGNPPYKILTSQDVSSLDFNVIKNEYKSSLSNVVKTYDEVKINPNILSGLKFTGPIQVSFNHGQSGSNYEVKISQGNVDYIITWNPKPPDAKIRKQMLRGQTEEFTFKFNGVIYSTDNLTVDGPTALSTYNGNYTLFSEKDVSIKDRIIPYQTYQNFFTASEHGNNGNVVSQSGVQQIKNFVSTSETSSLNIVAMNNVTIAQKLENMKIFASIFAFDGSFGLQGYDSGSPTGQLLVFGSIMQNIRGAVGTFNSMTGQTVTGYYKTYVYDPRIVTGAYQPYGTPTKSNTIRLFVLGVVK
ncbi:MAG: hypothetical protein ACP5JS_04340 [Fervidobacterium sp.]